MESFDLNTAAANIGHLMHIGVGNMSYDIEMTEENLLLNRKPVAAICDHSQSKVLINEEMASANMGLVISEAARMIYEYHYGHETVAS